MKRCAVLPGIQAWGSRAGHHEGKPLLGLDSFDHPPAFEARALMALVETGALTIDQTRQLIAFPERARLKLLEAGVPRRLVRSAADYRARVLVAFEKALGYPTDSKAVAAGPCAKKSLVPWSRRRRPVKIIDMLRSRPQEPAHPEDGPGKTARDVIGETGGICVECYGRVACRVLDDRALCAQCYRVEVYAQSH